VRLILDTAVALALALTPTAQAQPVSMRMSEDALALAAGGGHAVVAELEPFGAKVVVIRDLRLADRSDHVLLEIPYEGRHPGVTLAANGTGYVVAVEGAKLRVVQGGYDGSQRTLLECDPTRFSTLQLAAGVQGFAFANAPCGPAGPVVVGAGGSLAETGGPADGERLAYAEPFIARRTGELTRVRDLDTGQEWTVHTGLEADIAVAADGSVLASTIDGLFGSPRGELEQTLISDRASFDDVAVAGGRAIFDTLSVPRVVGLGGGTAHAISTPGAGLASVLGFDGTIAAFQSFSCRGARQVTFVAVDEPRAAGTVGGCPVRIAAFGLRFPPSGTATVRVRCPNGCRAGLRLVEQSTQERPCDALDKTGRNTCRVIATASLDLPPSQARRPVAFHLTAAGRRLRGRRLDVRISTRGGIGLTFYGEISRAVL
jgi:hypothetical protein